MKSMRRIPIYSKFTKNPFIAKNRSSWFAGSIGITIKYFDRLPDF